MKKLFFGAPIQVSHSQNDSTLSLIERTGKNTGNLLIGYSVSKHLDADYLTMGKIKDHKQVEEQCDCIVIPASNFINSHSDMGFMADFIEKVQLPCAIIGLGAQSDKYSNTKIPLRDGTLRFLKIIAERSVSLGVRGYYTAQVLAALGIYNVEVIGCPSFYLSGSSELNIKKKPFREVKKIAINGSRRVIKHSSSPEKMRLAELSLLADAMKYNCDFIAQDEPQEAMLARNCVAEFEDSLFNPIVAYYQNVPPENVINFFKHRSKVFFDVPSWERQIRKYDFVCGTRFHGNLIALQNGVPATVIAHDTRTRELSELLGVPHILVEEIDESKGISIQNLYESADFSNLDKAYPYLYRRYIFFLESNNLKHRLPVPVKENKVAINFEIQQPNPSTSLEQYQIALQASQQRLQFFQSSLQSKPFS